MGVHVAALSDTWTWNAVAYAASQVSTTWATVARAPRSTCSHCGSLAALDQRVPALPSTAALAGVPAFSVDDAVAGLPCDSSVVAAPARTVETTTATPAASATAAAMAIRGLRRRSAKLGRKLMHPLLN